MVGSRSFGPLLVVEIGRSAAGAYCGKLFADYGAETVTVGAGPQSSVGPIDGSFYDRAKATVAADDPAVDALVAEADVVIQAHPHSAVERPVATAHDRQVVVRISPFALDGPYAAWRSSELVDAAIAGHLRLSGNPDREPLQTVPGLVSHAAGVVGFIGAVAALIARARTGRGQTVETSHHEVLTALHQFTLCRYTHNGAVLNRLGNRYAGPGSAIGAYQCADGWIGLALPQDDQLERMLEVTGLISMLDRPDIDSVWDLMTAPDVLDSELIPYLLTQPRDETVELFQALRLPCAAVAEPIDVLTDPHLLDRGFWLDEPNHHDPRGTVRIPGPPFRMSGHDWTPTPKRRPPVAEPEVSAAPEPQTLTDGPLTGIRVLDMTRVWAGPLATRILADLGAEVLMTEVPWTRTTREVPDSYVQATHFFPDDQAGARPWNRSAFHNKYAINKLSTVIELDKPDGRELFAALVPQADVLVENYSPRVMPGFGFDADTLHRLNPDLIYVTMPGYGRAGPKVDWVAYGPTIDGHVGHTALTGYRGEGPWKSGIAWPDPIGGLHGAAGTLVALLDRFSDPGSDLVESAGAGGPAGSDLVESAGAGQTVEVAQVESAIHMIGHHLINAQLDPGVDSIGGVRPAERLGNRHRDLAPQGVYRCQGHDRWIAISVLDDAGWHALCREADLDDMAHYSLEDRHRHHDEIDRRLSTFAAGCDDQRLMERLQELGVAAGAAQSAPEVMADPQLEHLGFFAELSHPDAGPHRWPRFPARLSATPATMRTGAPVMGQDNRYAARTLAGLDEATYLHLVEAEVIRTEPPA